MNITIYCSSKQVKDKKLENEIINLCKYIAKNNHTLVYGGSQAGMMKLIADTVLDNNGKVIGVEAKHFVKKGQLYSRLTQIHIEDTIAKRRSKMIELGDLFIALPGGIGTLDEISEVMELKTLDENFGKVILFNYNNFYSPIIDMLDKMQNQDYLYSNYKNLFYFPTSEKEIENIIEKID